ncbi:sensor histidine kinase [Diplocloster modestus]|uniref:histidine kinase n=1 Tax=Diplocloster modestus TaxID=2850322 RepID=A0ABS6K8C1_9FIRM|nr:HAMP domain-containing sensor histidine kinase [Diplocloster modestus]MBU9726771.1 HAMP domain-containing histidine kinase [Diplocloster modestus]
MKTAKWTHLLSITCLAALLLFFGMLFIADNKYQSPPPYGNRGIIALTEADITRDTPLFLIDGWLLTDARVTQLPTYIGQFGSLQRGNQTVSPHGAAIYEIILRYDGAPVEAALSFPQLFSRHSIRLDGIVLSEGIGGARISFSLTPGNHLLTVETASTHGYYSGMYHPPALGTPETVSHMMLVQCVAYALAFFAPLTLALFTLTLWRSAKDRAAFWFGLLCCFFSLYVSYYFVHLFRLPVEEYWYIAQSAALYGLCFCTIRLTALFGDVAGKRFALFLQWIGGLFPLVLLALALLIPAQAWAVRLHSAMTDLFYFFTFCAVVALTLNSRETENWERRFSRLGCCVFGVGLLCNLFTSELFSALFLDRNLFEPIRFFWQFEWCGLLLVTIFGAMMAARNRRILAENAAFQTHLEELVQQRTAELTNLMQERKAFFADMAHDLKAPIFATGSFIQAIREHNTGVDTELSSYIDLVEQTQQEMARRVYGLTEFNKIDALSDPYEAVSVKYLLEETYELHHMAAEVQSVYLIIEPPEIDGQIYAQPRKLDILLENLIFNALKATPPEGQITLCAQLDASFCHLTLTDTGCGIPSEELQQIFNRFFVGKQNVGTGSGLGLFIVKCIVESLKGEIHVSSQPGLGTEFSINLPLLKQL